MAMMGGSRDQKVLKKRLGDSTYPVPPQVPQPPLAAPPVPEAQPLPSKSNKTRLWLIVLLVVLFGGGYWYHQTHLPLLNSAGDGFQRDVLFAAKQTSNDSNVPLAAYDTNRLPAAKNEVMLFEFAPDHICYSLMYDPNHATIVFAWHYQIEKEKIKLKAAPKRYKLKDYNFTAKSLADLAQGRGISKVYSEQTNGDDDETFFEFDMKKGAITTIWSYENGEKDSSFAVAPPLKLSNTADARLKVQAVYQTLEKRKNNGHEN